MRQLCLILLLGINLALWGCQSVPEVGGPVVAANTAGAGQLTFNKGSSYWVMPAALAFTGNATYRWPDGREYQGQWRNGQPHGEGKESINSILRYQGDWDNGAYQGDGELQLNDAHYVGQFVAGKRAGIGRQMAADGAYDGQWLNDLPHGQGQFIGNAGDSYKGTYKQGQRQGSGTFEDTDGSRYSGDWVDDAPHGFGELVQSNGDTYQGGWQQGKRSGYGVQHNSIDTGYEGAWVAGERHGFGKANLLDGNRYSGEWANDKQDGEGQLDYAEGGFHKGQWLAGQLFGTGTRVTKSGIQINGMFSGNQISSGLLQLPNGAEYAGRLFSRQMSQVTPALLEWTQAQANAGNDSAQLLLGTFYENFEVPEPNTDNAIRWYLSAAATVPEARFRLGRLLLTVEAREAVAHIQQAAQQGHRGANLLLGELYHWGRSVSPNAQTAIDYYETALANGSVQARVNLAWLLATSQEAHARDPGRAVQLIEALAMHDGSWANLDTLAAAYAAIGRFNDATRTAQQAIDALSAEAEQQRPALQSRLEGYAKQQPHTEILDSAD